MTDNELITALYQDGIPVDEIADKFEMRPMDVRHLLGITIDPRPERTRQKFLAALGDGEYLATEAAAKMGMPTNSMSSYLQRLVSRGHAAFREDPDHKSKRPRRLYRMLGEAE